MVATSDWVYGENLRELIYKTFPTSIAENVLLINNLQQCFVEAIPISFSPSFLLLFSSYCVLFCKIHFLQATSNYRVEAEETDVRASFTSTLQNHGCYGCEEDNLEKRYVLFTMKKYSFNELNESS